MARVSRAPRARSVGPRRIGFAGRGRAAARRASVRPVDRRIHDTRIKVHPIVRSGIGRYNLSYMRPSSVRSRDEKTLRLSAGTVIAQPSRRFFRPPRAVEGPAPSAWHRPGLRLAVRHRPPHGVAFPSHPRAGGERGDDAVAPVDVGGLDRSQRVHAAAEHHGGPPSFPRCSRFAARGPAARGPSVLSQSASSASFQFV